MFDGPGTSAMKDALIPSRWRRSSRVPAAPDIRHEIEQIEGALGRLRRAVGPSGGDLLDSMARAELDLVSAARQLLHDRRRRSELFGPDIFEDPAWDILLELFLAGEMKARASTTNVGIAAGLPSTIARRWVEVLAGRGLLRKSADREDPERIFVDLAPEAHEKMRRYLRDALTS